ncbi:uncharacterized protein DEA37_0008104 [Paragonimus westermani]|uniref:Uncharacterized protein n=1 Tax=Paragonimus westermani TaxID=34504 RepID=A0A5J4P1C6_9TREM|nr:uncharacterized protein DEA37_0008104 [Paragonimus westermani]
MSDELSLIPAASKEQPFVSRTRRKSKLERCVIDQDMPENDVIGDPMETARIRRVAKAILGFLNAPHPILRSKAVDLVYQQDDKYRGQKLNVDNPKVSVAKPNSALTPVRKRHQDDVNSAADLYRQTRMSPLTVPVAPILHRMCILETRSWLIFARRLAYFRLKIRGATMLQPTAPRCKRHFYNRLWAVVRWTLRWEFTVATTPFAVVDIDFLRHFDFPVNTRCCPLIDSGSKPNIRGTHATVAATTPIYVQPVAPRQSADFSTAFPQ